MLEQLQEFVETICIDRDFVKMDSVKSFLQNINDTHIFNVELKNPEEILKELKTDIEDCDWLNLPFANNFIIAEGTFIQKSYDIEFLGFSIQEIKPTYISVVSIARISARNSNSCVLNSFSFDIDTLKGELILDEVLHMDAYQHLVALSCSVLKLCLDRINKQVFTLVENEDKIDFKTRALGGYTRLKIKPSYIIYLGTEKHLLKSHPDLSNKILRNKPEFSYAVRGHWRRLVNSESLGKSRNGERNVKGFTFVSDFIKGHGELRKKIRVAK